MPNFDVSHNNIINSCCIFAFGRAQVVIQEGVEPVSPNARFHYDLSQNAFVTETRSDAKHRLKEKRFVKEDNIATRGRFYEQIVEDYGRYVVAYVVAVHGQKFFQDTQHGHALTAKQVQHLIVHLEEAKPLEPILKQLFQLDGERGPDSLKKHEPMEAFYAGRGMQVRKAELVEQMEGLSLEEEPLEAMESMRNFADVVSAVVKQKNQISQKQKGIDAFPTMGSVLDSNVERADSTSSAFALHEEEHLPATGRRVERKISEGLVRSYFQDDELCELQKKLNETPLDLSEPPQLTEQLTKGQARRLRSLLETARSRHIEKSI